MKKYPTDTTKRFPDYSLNLILTVVNTFII